MLKLICLYLLYRIRNYKFNPIIRSPASFAGLVRIHYALLGLTHRSLL
jgi:hypothetical protein